MALLIGYLEFSDPEVNSSSRALAKTAMVIGAISTGLTVIIGLLVLIVGTVLSDYWFPK